MLYSHHLKTCLGLTFYLKANPHIFYKLLKDDVTFLQTMSEVDISQKVKLSWNPDVKLYIYIQSLGHIVSASVLLFRRGPANSSKGRWAEFYINRYNIQFSLLGCDM